MVDDNGAMKKEKAGHGKEDGEFKDLGTYWYTRELRVGFLVEMIFW